MNSYDDAEGKSEDLLLRKRNNLQATNEELVATLYCRGVPFEERRGSPGVETRPNISGLERYKANKAYERR
jgi:hypothetical protein